MSGTRLRPAALALVALLPTACGGAALVAPSPAPATVTVRVLEYQTRRALDGWIVVNDGARVPVVAGAARVDVPAGVESCLRAEAPGHVSFRACGVVAASTETWSFYLEPSEP